MKDEIKYLIQHLKEEKYLDELQATRVIDFNDYFKYSGKVETKNKKFVAYERLLSDYPITKPARIYNNMDKYQLKKNRIWRNTLEKLK